MACAVLSRLDVKRACDSLVIQGQHPSIDELCIALGNVGLKTTIHRYLKELEEEEGVALARTGSFFDTIQDLSSAGGALGWRDADDDRPAARRVGRTAPRQPFCNSGPPRPGTWRSRPRISPQGQLSMRIFGACWTTSQALEHLRSARKERRGQEAHRHEQQTQQLRAELRRTTRC